jgi:decaprenylphospho-beta-D-erythro-pentofuranosid-2-ulose 2-reductase
VRDALGEVQSVVVLGGGSDIGRALCVRLARGRCDTVVLAGRPEDHMDVVEDLVYVPAGILGSQEAFDSDPAFAAKAVEINFAGLVSSCLAVAARMRAQGHGTIVVMSSVAGVRTRKDNFVYGSTKAGLDAFAQGLGDSLVGTGVRVMVVRPGFVHTKMTEGMDAAPFSTTAEQVADVIVGGLASGREVVYAPPVLRYPFAVLRNLPRAIWRKVAERG